MFTCYLLMVTETFTCLRHSTSLAFSLYMNSSGFITVAISKSDNSNLFTDNKQSQTNDGFSLSSTDYWDKCKFIVSIGSLLVYVS